MDNTNILLNSDTSFHAISPVSNYYMQPMFVEVAPIYTTISLTSQLSATADM